MKKATLIILTIVLFSLIFSTTAFAYDSNTFRPAVYYPYLVKYYPTSYLKDNPNKVYCNAYTSKSTLSGKLDDYWSSSHATEAADYIFTNQGAYKAYVYRYEWVSNSVWNRYVDNYGSYRESPENEVVVVGITSGGSVTCFVTHPHYTLVKYGSPSVTGTTHPILYFRGGHHGPYQTSGTGNSFKYWGYSYTIGSYYPAVVEN